MGSMTITLPEIAERRLREEAAKRNASAEDFAARLLADHLRYPVPAEFDMTDDEAQFYTDAVHKARSERLPE
ncbi:MAG: hypothetical protein H7144_17015 [Burkholderiales bacterium]|nr:hypothetical protein [Phycisphaerae bacterium]